MLFEYSQRPGDIGLFLSSNATVRELLCFERKGREQESWSVDHKVLKNLVLLFSQVETCKCPQQDADFPWTETSPMIVVTMIVSNTF
mmetsp:Transcript_4651/g.12992  ORF Transcript_4651/g.12992 Transcript_4651/m.12992 type:complete len:87 (-) Transcript_4651:181-441(-)